MVVAVSRNQDHRPAPRHINKPFFNLAMVRALEPTRALKLRPSYACITTTNQGLTNPLHFTFVSPSSDAL